MNLIISRTRRYGGITTFLFNYFEVVKPTSEDILLLDPNIDYKILCEIKRRYDCNIIYFPKSIFEKYIILKRLHHSIFILKMLKNNTHIKNVVFTDWNIVLDWLVHTKKMNFLTFVHTYPNKEIPYFLRKLISRLTKYTHIVTVSKFSKSQISKKWHIDERVIKVLYNYSNLPGENVSRELPKDEINIVTIAHCEQYKNPQLWFNIAKKVSEINSNIHFHWYGDGSLFEEFRKMSSAYSNINFHGYSNRVELILKKKSTVYVQFSKVESLGISILDAMNYSIPIIISNIGGMPELVINNENGFVSNKEDELVKRILTLSSNEDLYSRMSKNSKDRYNKHFSKKTWKNNLNKILIQLQGREKQKNENS